jgi:hypothetical protein
MGPSAGLDVSEKRKSSMFSFVFYGVWSLIANVSEHSVCSIFIDEWVGFQVVECVLQFPPKELDNS